MSSLATACPACVIENKQSAWCQLTQDKLEAQKAPFAYVNDQGNCSDCGHKHSVHLSSAALTAAPSSDSELKRKFAELESELQATKMQLSEIQTVKHSKPSLAVVSASDWQPSQLEALNIRVVRTQNFVSDILLKQNGSIKPSLHIESVITLLHDVQDGDHPKDLTVAELPTDSVACSVYKALFLMKKYHKCEAAVSNLVWHILNLVGANDGTLMAFPQFPAKFTIRGVKRDAIADWTVMDILTYLRICVVEDKSVLKMQEADAENDYHAHEPQAIAQVIAAVEINRRKVSNQLIEQDQELQSEEKKDDQMFMIRVLGGLFSFYRVPVSTSLLNAVQLKEPPPLIYQTEVKCYTGTKEVGSSSLGLNPAIPEERAEILRCLDMMIQYVRPLASSTERRHSDAVATSSSLSSSSSS